MCLMLSYSIKSKHYWKVFVKANMYLYVHGTPWYTLASHHNSPCSGLFEHPTDHYHLVVWFDDKSKAQDLAFHKRFYQWQHGSDWRSEKVKSERGIVQYIQCEPQELVELYSSKDHAKFVQHCWETRDEMQAKISVRDSAKTDKKKILLK